MNYKTIRLIDSLKYKYPEKAAKWDYTKNGVLMPEMVTPGSNKYVFWICPFNHSYKQRIWNTVQAKGNNCDICLKRRIVPGVNDLFTEFPSLKEEWDYEKNESHPECIHSGIQKEKFYWKCKKCGDSWLATPYSRAIMNSGCPTCCNQKVQSGYNDVATLLPEIIPYWDYSKNDLKPEEIPGKKSNKKVNILCPVCNHSWSTKISDFSNGKRCPVCANRVVIPGINDLLTTHKELAQEWDYEKNGDLLPNQVTYGSDKVVWWKCRDCGNEWKATISSRSSGRGCEKCNAVFQVSFPEKAIFYYLSKQIGNIKENVCFDFLGKRELDIYIPELMLAIEYDGKNYHKDVQNDYKKDELCRVNGVRLIRIREAGCPSYSSSSIKIECQEIHKNILLFENTINKIINVINKYYSLNLKNISVHKEDGEDILRLTRKH